jgi:hypothetical protein
MEGPGASGKHLPLQVQPAVGEGDQRYERGERGMASPVQSLSQSQKFVQHLLRHDLFQELPVGGVSQALG